MGSLLLKGVGPPAFSYESWGGWGDTEESITGSWDKFEARFLFSLLDPDGLFLPPGPGVEYSCVIECEHCLIHVTKITVLVISKL